jgi:hypothetical protein
MTCKAQNPIILIFPDQSLAGRIREITFPVHSCSFPVPIWLRSPRFSPKRLSGMDLPSEGCESRLNIPCHISLLAGNFGREQFALDCAHPKTREYQLIAVCLKGSSELRSWLSDLKPKLCRGFHDLVLLSSRV